jgi:hypothetical protein
MDFEESLLLPVPVSLANIAQKKGEKMQAHARGPLGVTQEAVDAFDMQTGFQGLKMIMVEHTVRVLVPFQGVVQPPWRPAPAWAFGNAGQHLNNTVASSRNGACPATRPARVLSPLPAGGVAP